MGEITILIRAVQRGDRDALDRLFSLLYDDLHRIAHARVRAGGPNTLLDTTGLVHETSSSRCRTIRRARGERRASRTSANAASTQEFMATDNGREVLGFIVSCALPVEDTLVRDHAR